MAASLLPSELKAVSSALRLVAILDGAERVGTAPLRLQTLHSIAYFTDALAPVWNLPVMNGQILKRMAPYYPTLQYDLDRLVGCGVVDVSDVAYREIEKSWVLDASYRLRYEAASNILAVAESYPRQAAELAFVREVVYATAGLGLDGVDGAPTVDATYSDPLIDIGGVIDVDPEGAPNLSAGVALRFGSLLAGNNPLGTAEMVNLYVRHLYARLYAA